MNATTLDVSQSLQELIFTFAFTRNEFAFFDIIVVVVVVDDIEWLLSSIHICNGVPSFGDCVACHTFHIIRDFNGNVTNKFCRNV